ncbi:GAF domain-containing protein [Candidatus Aerophobetes bacterium]|nr:GAF domain-containing protein [Candidatus Aerophobetes bacterium]
MQLDVLSRVSKTIVSNRYLKEMLQLIVTMTAQVMNSKICSIMLLDNKKQELFIAATQSLSEEYTKKPNLKVGQSISGKVIKEKRPITVLDVTREPGYMYPEIAKREGIVSMLSVPMMIKERVIGVINSYTSYEHKFTDEEVKILQAIANQAAVAIESTNLTQELIATKQALETRKLVERAKGLLMKELSLSEDEAYKLINKKAMDTRKTMREVAEAIILFMEMRKGS